MNRTSAQRRKQCELCGNGVGHRHVELPMTESRSTATRPTRQVSAMICIQCQKTGS